MGTYPAGGSPAQPEAKGRVLVEMRRRSGPSGGLPPKLQATVTASEHDTALESSGGGIFGP